MNKVLTISIAAYNVEEYLAETLDSCIVHPNLQSYLEVLIVDDGSTDGTLEIAQEYEKEYPEVFHVISKENGGYGSTINAALKIATGKYQKGDIVEVSFKTRLQVAPNKYTLSFSCTHFKPNGELEVLNRKYDALLVEIISSKEHVGILSLDTEINIEKKDK